VTDFEALLRWYLVLTGISLAFLPLTEWLVRSLGTARYGLVRPLGIVILTVIVWWPAALIGLPFARLSLLLAGLAGACACWAWWFRRSGSDIDWKALAGYEAIWLGAFLLYAWFRSFNPAILNTEKPMEIALLSATIRSNAVPAPDPWFAGEAINYYYFGYQCLATVAKLGDVPSPIAFNLGLATAFASAATAAAAIGAGLGRLLRGSPPAMRVTAGLASMLLLLAGNLETPRRLLANPRGTLAAGWWDGVGWQASRVIVDTNVHQTGDSRQTINEFPAFSFVLGDLHPHVIAYPLLASIVAVAVAFAASQSRVGKPRLMLAGGLIGLLYATNSWDAPAAWLVVIGALALHHRWMGRAVVRDAVIVTVGALVAALPFLLHYTAPVGVTNHELPVWLVDLPLVGTLASTFGLVYWRPSSAGELITVHGAWIAALLVFAAIHLRREPEFRADIVRHRHLLLTTTILAAGVAIAWAPAVVIVGVPLAIASWLTMRGRDSGIRVVAGLYALGFWLVLVPEFVFLQDVFLDRMNTVFKLYFQAWLLLSVATAAALVSTLREVPRAGRWFAITGVALGLAATLTYTPISAWDWSEGFAARQSLDGSQYLATSAPDDFAAITWIRTHASTDDTLVEAPGNSYQNVAGAPMSRISAFSGVPALIGWIGHESQWRRGTAPRIDLVLEERRVLADRILNGGIGPDQTTVRFVIWGNQESFNQRTCDATAGVALAGESCLREAGWVPAFRAGGTVILVHPDDALAVPTR
jgi:YYY domain-containing protein